MRFKFVTVALVFVLAGWVFGMKGSWDGAALAGIGSSDSAVVQRSIEQLRNAGPEGLGVLLEQYDRKPDAKLEPVIDAVAGQRGAVVSRLYWYTDLNRAEAAADAEHKPILYLRLMGKLTDEYSCANSRFFRTVLYSNAEVSAMLRKNFVLVWVSERPVPIITVDYGDGRTLKRTITGNSIHYVLDSKGRVLDALPGLFDPATFLQIVSEAGGLAQASEWAQNKYLQRADDAILRQWKQDASAVNPQLIKVEGEIREGANNRNAAKAMILTASKMYIEAPLLRAMSPQFASAMDRSIDVLDDSSWRKIAALHAEKAKLDEQSIEVIRGQNPKVYADRAALEKTVQQFQETIAEDSVRDNYKMRRQVLAWLRDRTGPIGLEDLNRRVYSELFLTPRSDPWIGLKSEGMYTGLMCDGCGGEGMAAN